MSISKHIKPLFAIIVTANLTIASSVLAEAWPPLRESVSKCVLIVKARATDDPDKNGMRRFKILETWKGRFDPADFGEGMAAEETVLARDGEHGVRVTRGQEIILFYTRQNQPDEKLHTHSAAFPIKHGEVVYAPTSDLLREEMTVGVFKQRITASAASTQPTNSPTSKP